MNDPRKSFGPTAASYLTSAVHSDKAALEHLVELVQPRGGVAIDIATGAGHTAYAFAPFVQRMIATDITPDMLALTRKTAATRGISNLDVLFAAAEDLPFAAQTLDGVACRMGAHHFQNVKFYLAESFRALRSGGWFLLVDTVGAEDDEADELLDSLERLRDPSHVRNYRPSQWTALAKDAGFEIATVEVRQKEIGAEDWMERMQVPLGDRETLRKMLSQASGKFAEYLDQFERDGHGFFHLAEMLLLAKKPSI